MTCGCRHKVKVIGQQIYHKALESQKKYKRMSTKHENSKPDTYAAIVNSNKFSNII